jgi:hypothetical protein
MWSITDRMLLCVTWLCYIPRCTTGLEQNGFHSYVALYGMRDEVHRQPTMGTIPERQDPRLSPPSPTPEATALFCVWLETWLSQQDRPTCSHLQLEVILGRSWVLRQFLQRQGSFTWACEFCARTRQGTMFLRLLGICHPSLDSDGSLWSLTSGLMTDVQNDHTGAWWAPKPSWNLHMISQRKLQSFPKTSKL